MIAASRPMFGSLGAVVLGLLATSCARTSEPAVATPPVVRVDVANAIVVVEADGVDPDFAAPWGTGKSWTRTMTGLVVDGQRILVGGWGLHGQRHVRVEKPGAAAWSDAREVLVDLDQGLALLSVADPSFWIGVSPAVVSDAVSPSGPVQVHHVTSDARVEVSAANVAGLRAFGRTDVLHLKLGHLEAKQVAISDVIADGTMVRGIVDHAGADDVAAVTSRHLADFLAEAKRPTYRGYAAFAVSWQGLKSPPLRAELGLGPDEGGVRVTRVHPLRLGSDELLPGDVLLTIDGAKIESDGTCDCPGLGRVPLATLLSEGHHPGDAIAFGVRRDGATKTVNVTLKACPGSADLVPYFAPREEGKGYLVEGGLVFENLTGEYLFALGKDWESKASQFLVEAYYLDRWNAPEAGAHVVVLTRVLADPATLGYQQLRELIVETVNGVRVRSIDELPSAFAHPTGGFDVVTFAPGQPVSRIVLDAKEEAAANERLRGTYELSKPAN